MPQPPVVTVVSFIDCVNRNDVEGLGVLMTDDHELHVFNEEPLVGRQPNIDAWRGYCERFSAYVIYPRFIADRGGRVAVLGHTTGSHLGLPDLEESQRTLIWLVDVVGGAIRRWTLLEDTAVNRRRLGIPNGV